MVRWSHGQVFGSESKRGLYFDKLARNTNLQSLLDVIEDLYWPGGDKMALDGIGHFGFPFPGIPFPAESASVI